MMWLKRKSTAMLISDGARSTTSCRQLLRSAHTITATTKGHAVAKKTFRNKYGFHEYSPAKSP